LSEKVDQRSSKSASQFIILKKIQKPMMKINFSRMIPYLSVLLISFACSKKDIMDDTSGINSEPVETVMSVAGSFQLKVEAEDYTTMKGINLDDCSEGGKNVGGIQAGDWMDYSVNIPAAGSYKVNFRVAGPGGKFKLQTSSGTVLASITAPKTVSYQTYTTVSANVKLSAGQQTLRIYAVSGGYNINWFEFPGSGTTGSTDTNTATTQKMEAENYTSMQGVILDNCSEGGKNVGGIQSGDWMNYSVNIATAGSYKVNFRVAGPGGTFRLQTSSGTVLANVTAPKTSGYQSYTTVSANVTFSAGQQTVRIYAVSGGYNINWFEILGASAGTDSGGTSDDTSDNTTTPVTSGTTPTVSSNIIYRETFEGSSVWPGGLGNEWATSYGFQVVSSPVSKGAKAGRFELRDGDADTYARSEVRWPSTINGVERWMSFSVYWPSNGMAPDSKPEIFHQTHQTSKTSPPLSMLIKNNRILAEINGQVFSGTLGTGTSKTIDLGDVPKDQWVRFVFHYRFSYNTDGVWQVWQNGKQVVNYSGKTIYPPAITSSLPSFKLGIYKWPWAGTGSSDAKLRIMHVDDVRIGNEKCTYADL
jgi:hypothetical protein